MSYELLVLAFMMLVFCFFTVVFITNVMISVLNAAKDEKDIKPISIITRPERKPKKSATQIEAERRAAEEKRKMEIIARNLEAFDGTGIGQEEVK